MENKKTRGHKKTTVFEKRNENLSATKVYTFQKTKNYWLDANKAPLQADIAKILKFGAIISP